jgi:hypothetical protein
MPAVVSKNRPLYVLPSESTAFIVPETESTLCQVTLTGGAAPVTVEPNPAPAAVQPPTKANNSRNAGFNVQNGMPRLLFQSCKRKVVERWSMFAPDRLRLDFAASAARVKRNTPQVGRWYAAVRDSSSLPTGLAPFLRPGGSCLNRRDGNRGAAMSRLDVENSDG